jgi:type I restriction enzyme S subunit
MPRHLEYKDSGVPLLGSIPSHWSAARLKEVIRSIESGVSVNATDVPATEGAIGVLKTSCVYDGTFRVAENKAVVEEDLSRVSCPVAEGTLIVSRMNTPALVGAAGLVTQSHPDIYLPDRLWQVSLRNSSPSFVHYWTLSGEYRAQVEVACSGTSSSMQNLGQDQFRNFQIALPLEDEQHAIATFLDRETAKIDALIAEQEKLLALLAEKRQATISHAVTRGLNPNVPMKDSGIPWLGEVPAHWDVMALGKVTISKCDGPFGSGLKSGHYVDEGARVIRLQNIRGGRFDDRDAAFIELAYFESEMGRHEVRNGDLLIAGLGDDNNVVGRACVAPKDIYPAMVKADCFRFRLDTDRVLPQFAAWALTVGSTYDAGVLSSGSTRSRIPLSVMASRKIPLPSIGEQLEINRHIEALQSELDRLATSAERAIELLRERRSALISAAVTGKIDVRHAV